jgi:hypothetical protein
MSEAYFSTDIEADGPIPGPYSMSSIGLVIPGFRTNDGSIRRIGREAQPVHYVELKPISEHFIPEAARVSGLDRVDLITKGTEPADAMAALNTWITDACVQLADSIQERVRPVFAAYPLGFDWLFYYWYSIEFTGSSPFGHSTAIDMKTLFASKANRAVVRSTKRDMPRHLRGEGPHTHHALDDAREQGEMLMNLLEWKG